MAYIINRHGVLHSIPDTMPMPAGARKASKDEISEWQAQDAANKETLRAQKLASAQARAQLVVNVTQAPEVTQPEPSKTSKGKDDGKQSAE